MNAPCPAEVSPMMHAVVCRASVTLAIMLSLALVLAEGRSRQSPASAASSPSRPAIPTPPADTPFVVPPSGGRDRLKLELRATPTPDSLLEELKKLYPHNKLHDPKEQQKEFIVHPDFEVSLFAASPWVINPVAMTWDNRGRLWVINSPMYPQILPGQRAMDFISVLEDADGDGRADKCTIFYDKLYVPTGLELGDGGVYVANQPDLLYLTDADGDLRADKKTVLLSGFGTEDNHHAISAFRWSPGGWLHFMSGVFLHTQVETPHGLLRLDDGGTFQFRPRLMKLEMYNIGTATNPWGLAFDQWGQSFLTEGPQGGIWWLTPATVVSRPRERVPGTNAPKACGNEFIYSSHFSEKYRDLMVLNAFKNKSVHLYEFSDDGAGFATKELQPALIASNEPFFRPVDVKMGPDGAIYIADFFQEIIGHMQFEFRDPRRDHLNGRIWRVTQKNRKPLPRPEFVQWDLEKVCEGLKSPDGYVRDKCRRELYERSARQGDAVEKAIKKFVAGLDRNDAHFEHHRLEALWALQTVEKFDLPLLEEVLASKEPRARAAAVAALRYWHERIPEKTMHALLEPRIVDEHPRVRLEAICTASYLNSAAAMQLIAQAADKPMDKYLEYSFRHAAIALKDKWLPEYQAGRLTFGDKPARVQAVLAAVKMQDPATLLGQLKTGRVPAERREADLHLVALLGDADLMFEVFDAERFAQIMKVSGGEYDAALHARVLGSLARAARERKAMPREGTIHVAKLLASPHEEVRAAALRLTGAWKRNELRETINKFARGDADGATPAVRRAAIDALVELGGKESVETLEQLCGSTAADVPIWAIAAITRLDVKKGAARIAEALTAVKEPSLVELMMEAALSQEHGAELLLEGMKKHTPNADAAKLALRYMNATGRIDEKLTETFQKVIGGSSLVVALAKEDIKKLIDEVKTQGDPKRGEQVFRRKDLACLTCHAVARGGGDLGPDLEGLGASSPLDYLIESILLPNKAVREGFAGIKVLTDEGKLYTGILVAKNDKELVLRDAASRQLVRLPAASVKRTADAGSIMPQNLVDQMTRAEFIDLVRFVSELGKPGEFATPNLPFVRSWRVLSSVPADLASAAPEAFGRLLPHPDNPDWSAAYSRVSAELPVGDMGGKRTAVIQARIDVGTGGKLKLLINEDAGLELFVDGQPVPAARETVIDVKPGIRRLTFRIDRDQRKDRPLKVELADVAGSPARAQVVNGP